MVLIKTCILVEQIICLFHSDMFPDSEDIFNKLKHLSTIYIEIEYDSKNRQGKSMIRKKLATGKIEKNV